MHIWYAIQDKTFLKSLTNDQQGLIRALEEFGIPIDHIGGTSIGAFIGGLYAWEANIILTGGRAKQFSGRMGNMWRMISDVTYPIIAYTTVKCDFLGGDRS